ncbi:MAG: dihydroorotase [Gammaproteobacteria bacterium]|nr:MAG: dihydroorotase [Gammaproteobacteria bacterium]
MTQAMSSILIQGGRVIDPASQTDQITDILIEQGKIRTIGPCGDLPSNAERQTINASGLIVSPGFIDLCARLREPGSEYKGTIASETNAAAASGITRLCVPPDTDPVIDTPAVAALIQDLSETNRRCNVSIIGALTQGLEGQQLSEMYALKQAGCIAVSNAWQPIHSNQTIQRCMEYASTFDLTLFINPQDHALAQNGCAHEGPTASKLGLPTIPETAETIAVAQYLLLAEHTNTRIHFSQLSTQRSLDLIQQAKDRNMQVSADVSAHQLILTDEYLSEFEGVYHLRPPLRSVSNRDGLRAGIRSGVITGICSDHQPHELAAKMAPFEATEPGISSLETLLPLTLRLVDNGSLTLNQAIACLTQGPAAVIQNNEGQIKVGRLANLCIFDPLAEYQLTEQTLKSTGKNSPFLNQTLKGQVRYTVLDGEISYQA